MVSPNRISSEDIAELHQVIRNYPYFHNAHLLLLFGLYHHNFEKFEAQLKQSAVFLSSRSQLLRAIIHGWSDVSTSPDENNVRTPEVIHTISADLPVNEVIDAKTDEEAVKENVPVSTEVKLPEPVFSYDETFSFSLEDTQPIEISEKREDEINDKSDLPVDLLEFDLGLNTEDEKVDLIDTFLKVNPRIVPKLDLEDSRGDISQACLEEDEEIVTETLASIYEQQGHFVKAKEAYEKLILKFPEKSTYFASRIQELEKRIK